MIFLMKFFYSNCNTQVYLLTVTVCSGAVEVKLGFNPVLLGVVTFTPTSGRPLLKYKHTSHDHYLKYKHQN